jgi:hypothetical protein
MAMRVKNIAAGFVDSTGFHPIRSSADYDPDRAGDDYSQRSVRGPSAKRKKKATGKKPKPGAHRTRSKNPITTKWVTSKVRRVGNDIQVMLFPKGKVARRRAKRRTARRHNPGNRYSIKTQYTSFATANTITAARVALKGMQAAHPGSRIYIYDNETGTRVSLRRLPRSRTPRSNPRRGAVRRRR